MNKNWLRNITYIVSDSLALIVALALSVLMRYGFFIDSELILMYMAAGVDILVLNIAAAYIIDAYDNMLGRSTNAEIREILLQLSAVTAGFVMILFLNKVSDSYSRIVICLQPLIGALLIFLFRNIVRYYLKKYYSNYKNKNCFIVIAARSVAEKTMKQLSEARLEGNSINMLCIYDEDMQGEHIGGYEVVTNKKDLFSFILERVYDTAFINIPGHRDEEHKLAESLIGMGMNVHIYLSEGLEDLKNESVVKVGGLYTLKCSMHNIAAWQMIIKRTVDIIGGIVGAILAILIGIMIGPIIYFKDPGPIIFKQRRVGQNGRWFNVYKFRSMYMNAEERKKELMRKNNVEGNLMFKIDDDPRILKGIGNFIRKTSLDEFPQFFNVLKGDMSLVGTRPPTVDEYERYMPKHKKRLAIKPGISGLWQVSGRSEIKDFEEVVRLDAEYISNYSLRLDIKILFKTILTVVMKKGAL